MVCDTYTYPVTDLQRKIIELRGTGLSYRAIAQQASCTLTTVKDALIPGHSAKRVKRETRRRQKLMARLKMDHGGECIVCGYDKFLGALDFDHLEPKEKSCGISGFTHLAKAEAEAQKCFLICCRCHRERHAGVLDIGPYLPPEEFHEPQPEESLRP